tara:strand:+ start:6 stop:149 length:144 start_codon:yes stop_codon:yes gene_type:complete
MKGNWKNAFLWLNNKPANNTFITSYDKGERAEPMGEIIPAYGGLELM